MCQVAMHRHGFHLFIREKNDPWYRRRSVTALVQDSSSLFEKKMLPHLVCRQNLVLKASKTPHRSRIEIKKFYYLLDLNDTFTCTAHI